MNPMQRISRLRGMAAPWQVREGAVWYIDAASRIMDLAHEVSLPPPVVAAAIAALSPGQQWAHQRTASFSFVRDEVRRPGSGRHGGYGVNIRKASIILATGRTELARGPKVSAFARALLGDLSAVVLDRHAIGAALALPPEAVPNLGPQRRAEIENAYRRTAEEHDEAPAQTQAIVWTQWRSLRGIAYPSRRSRT